MPDLKTEMSKVIAQWNDDETPTTMQKTPVNISSNVTRATFERVASNPGITRAEAVASLSMDGYKKASTTSLLSQMIDKGNIQMRDDKLYAAQKEYAPLPRRYDVAPNPRRTVHTPAPVLAEPPAPVQPVSTMTTDTLLENMSIKQAREVYDELKKIFGGA